MLIPTMRVIQVIYSFAEHSKLLEVTFSLQHVAYTEVALFAVPYRSMG